MARQNQEPLTHTLDDLQTLLPAGEWISTYNVSKTLQADMALTRDLIHNLPKDKVVIAKDAIYDGNDEYLFVDGNVHIANKMAYAVRQFEQWAAMNKADMVQVFQCRIDALTAYMEIDNG